jgi:hypothetical protein
MAQKKKVNTSKTKSKATISKQKVTSKVVQKQKAGDNVVQVQITGTHTCGCGCGCNNDNKKSFWTKVKEFFSRLFK